MRQLPTLEEFTLQQVEQGGDCECYHCHGTGETECDCCGHETECEYCDGTGEMEIDQRYNPPPSIYHAALLEALGKWCAYTGADRFEAYASFVKGYKKLLFNEKPYPRSVH